MSKTSVFLSYPKPFNDDQENFINALSKYMRAWNLEPHTLGVTDYDTDIPLRAIRRLMLESNGIVTIAFRRTLVQRGSSRPGTSFAFSLDGKWLTSPYAQIEPAMAFQIGLPTLILRENGVLPEGLLEKGIVGLYMPEFELGASVEAYLKSEEWLQIFRKWEHQVSSVREKKGLPPSFY